MCRPVEQSLSIYILTVHIQSACLVLSQTEHAVHVHHAYFNKMIELVNLLTFNLPSSELFNSELFIHN